MARVKYFDPVTESWKYADRRSGSDGKSAYEYALDGGYTGSEEEFAAKMAAESPGIHTGPEEPTDDSVFWIDTDEDPEDMPNGGNVDVTFEGETMIISTANNAVKIDGETLIL